MPCVLVYLFLPCSVQRTEPAVIDVVSVDVTFGFPYNVNYNVNLRPTLRAPRPLCTAQGNTNNSLPSNPINVLYPILSTAVHVLVLLLYKEQQSVYVL
jgi:hypothetical protein